MFWVEGDCRVHSGKVILLLNPSVFQINYTSVFVLFQLLLEKNVLIFFDNTVFDLFFFLHHSVEVLLVRNGVLRLNIECLG